MPRRQSPPHSPDVTVSSRPTIALWTPSGRGAVASLRLQGDLQALFAQACQAIPFHAVNRKTLTELPIGRTTFGHWGGVATEDTSAESPAEEVVVCRISLDEWEVHCHGGVAAARRIIDDCVQMGLEVIPWQDQLLREVGQFQVDIASALTRATTLRTAGILLDQVPAWQSWAESITQHAATGGWTAIPDMVNSTRSWSPMGSHLLKPFRVVLTGAPNVGKSALLNALVGYQRSVVFDQPGTTRDVVTAEAAFDGWPVRLIDTAGLRDNAEGLEAAGIQLALGQLDQADLILHVSSVTSQTQSADPVRESQDSRAIYVVNKIDLLDAPPAFLNAGIIPVSAKTGEGFENLMQAIISRLVPVVPEIGCAIPIFDYQLEWLNSVSQAVQQQSVEFIREIAVQISRSSVTHHAG